MKQLKILASGLCVLFAINAYAETPVDLKQTPVEVKLVAPIEEDRGWCLDLRGGQRNGAPIGGVHGHTCYTYNGNGPTPDQAFIKENIEGKNEFRMVGFSDKCMTLYEPNEGSFVSIESCDGREAQAIVLNEDGRIIPELVPDLCLTAGTIVLPGGGGRPLHIMRDISFEACDSEINERQRWELRAEWTGPEETTAERPYADNPDGQFGPP